MLVPLVALAYVCLVIWASVRFFRNPTGVRPGLHRLWIAGALAGSFLALTYSRGDRGGPGCEGSALALFAAAFAMFLWALATNRRRPLSLAWSVDAPEHLVTRGPYRWVRHPFYLSYILAWTGAALVTAAPASAVVPAVVCLLFLGTARQEEEKFARSPLAAEYGAYRRLTGMFLPRIFPPRRTRTTSGSPLRSR